jgi:cell division protein FtsI (penicillin-binding protein 3)
MAEGLKQSHPGRIALAIGLIMLWIVLIIARLGQLQILEHQEFARRASERQLKTQVISAPRGVIYDSHMDELASSVTVSSVAAEPRRIEDIPAAAKALAKVLNIDGAKLQRQMRDPSKQLFMYVKRRIDPQAEPLVRALDLRGIYFMDEYMRVYPNRNLASHLLGFVNLEGDPGAGLEQQYNSQLKGTDGLVALDVDAHRRSFGKRVETPPVQGHSLVLSIDRSIQYIVERELASGIRRVQATAGTAIVMESETGRILALANHPNFNCNLYNTYKQEIYLNPAVSKMYEPGSTFKVVVATAALEAGLAHPDETIYCQEGSIVLNGHLFHDHKPFGLLTFAQILENSSNVGVVKLGLRLGERRLYEALRLFGFGSKTNVDLPAEIVGLIRNWQNWSKLSIGAISFGQEIGATPMQMAVAFNAIANGGYRVRPSLVDRIIDHKGDLVRVRVPEKTRIVSRETAAVIRRAFEGVVLRGTGKQAALEGYRAAGKTGTAQKIVDGRYSNTKFLASFIGFAPLPQPRITVLVQIDEPKGVIYGGDVAGPVFAKIAQQVLLSLHVPPDQSMPLPKPDPPLVADSEDFLPNATPVLPLSAMDNTIPIPEETKTITVSTGTDHVVLPDFTGMSKREVVERCLELGLRVQTSGSGAAVFQVPPPDTRILRGDSCSVTFARGSSNEHRKGAGPDAGFPKDLTGKSRPSPLLSPAFSGGAHRTSVPYPVVHLVTMPVGAASLQHLVRKAG